MPCIGRARNGRPARAALLARAMAARRERRLAAYRRLGSGPNALGQLHLTGIGSVEGAVRKPARAGIAMKEMVTDICRRQPASTRGRR